MPIVYTLNRVVFLLPLEAEGRRFCVFRRAGDACLWFRNLTIDGGHGNGRAGIGSVIERQVDTQTDGRGSGFSGRA